MSPQESPYYLRSKKQSPNMNQSINDFTLNMNSSNLNEESVSPNGMNASQFVG